MLIHTTFGIFKLNFRFRFVTNVIEQFRANHEEDGNRVIACQFVQGNALNSATIGLIIQREPTSCQDTEADSVITV